MPAAPITAEDAVHEVMSADAATIPVFIRHRLLCIGCPVGPFHSIREACRAHGADLDAVLADLARAARETR